MNTPSSLDLQAKDNGILSYISYSKIKPYITALQAMPRRDVYLDQSKVDLYKKQYVKRDLDEYIAKSQNNTLTDKDIADLIENVLEQVNQAPRDNHKTAKGYLDGILPEDGDTWNHTKTQTKIARKYGDILLENKSITLDQKKILEILSMIHDIAESIVGDRVISMKKDDFTKFEFEVGKFIIKEIAKSQEIADQLLNIYQICFIKENGLIDETSVSDSDKQLAEHFSLLEKIGYLASAHRAKQFESDIRDEGHLGTMSKYNSAYIIYNVLTNQIKSLDQDKNLDHKSIITSFCKEYQDRISDLFVYVEESDFLLSQGPKDNISVQDKMAKFYESIKSRNSLWQKIK